MTTPIATPAQQAAEQFRVDLRADLAEIMDELHSQRAELINVRADLEAIRAGLTQAASQPAPASEQTKTFLAVAIVHGIDDNGKPTYKMRGGPYAKNGVRVWPEVLEAIGYNLEKIKPGITEIKPPLEVRVQMHNYYDDAKKETRVTPYKVTGKA